MSESMEKRRDGAFREGLLVRFPLLVLLCLAASCSTLRSGSDFDHAASFTAYRTYAWMPRERYGSQNPLVAQRAHDAIEEELRAKGFSPASDPSAPDFVVDLTIGSKMRTDIQSYPSPYVGGWWTLDTWWGHPYWGYAVDVRQYREGTLSIDVFDGRSHRPVWHGWAKKDLTKSDVEHSEGPIREAVHAILQAFPPR